jgi:nucleoid-associated protein YgaU
MANGVDLGKQVGPLPLGAWVVVVGAGLGIAYYSRNAGKNAAAPLTVPDPSGDPNVGTGPGWVAVPPPSTAPASGTAAPTDNDAWGRLAIDQLVADGYNPALVYSAITKALAGGSGDNKMSIQEYSLWSLALRKLGTPPVPVLVPPPTSIPIPTPTPTPTPKPVPKPVPPPAPKPTSYRYYTVQKWPKPGSSLWTIAGIVYHNPLRWGDIYRANRKGVRRADGKTGMISNANVLQPGWVLLIPR